MMTSYFRSLAFGIHGYSSYTAEGFERNVGRVSDIMRGKGSKSAQGKESEESASANERTNDCVGRGTNSSEAGDVMEKDLRGISVLVTGANGGIGFAIASELARRNATVHLLCRDKQKGEEASKKILECVNRNADLHLHVCDLGNVAEVRSFVEAFTGSGFQLHVLVNNAAVLMEKNEKSVDGYEMSFAVNTLGQYLLTSSLRPVLGRTSESQRGHSGSMSGKTNLSGYFGVGPQSPIMSSDGVGTMDVSQGRKSIDLNNLSIGRFNALMYVPRVITVSSAGMLAEELITDDLEYEKPRKYSGVTQYARDKRRQVALTERWAKLAQKPDVLFSGSGKKKNNVNSNSSKENSKQQQPDILYVSMHPGWVDTPGLKQSLPGFYNSMSEKLRTPEQGADTILYLICQEAKKIEPGAFYFDRKPVAKHIRMGFTAYSEKDVEKLAKKLDSLSCEASVHGSFRNGMNFHKSSYAAGEPMRQSSKGKSITGGKKNIVHEELFRPRSVDSVEAEEVGIVYTPRKWHGFNIR